MENKKKKKKKTVSNKGLTKNLPDSIDDFRIVAEDAPVM